MINAKRKILQPATNDVQEGLTSKRAVLIQHRPKITNATPTSSVDAADMIRTYDVVADRALHKKPYLPRAIGHKDDDVPILKTLLAAVAVPGHFPPVAIKGTPHSGVGSKYNNPTSQAFDEGARLYNMKAGEDRQRYDDKRVGIVVSIGAGKEAPRDFLRPWDVYRRMIFRGKSTDRKLSDPGKVHNDMKGRLQAADIPYFRFDGPDLPKCKYDDWSPQTLAIIKKETNSYLARESVKLDIILLARYLVAYRRGRYITRQEDLFPAPTVQEMDAAGSNPIRNNTWPYAESASTLANHIDPSLLRIGRRSQSDNHLPRLCRTLSQTSIFFTLSLFFACCIDTLYYVTYLFSAHFPCSDLLMPSLQTSLYPPIHSLCGIFNHVAPQRELLSMTFYF